MLKKCQIPHPALYGFIESKETHIPTYLQKNQYVHLGHVHFYTKIVLKVPQRVYQWVPYTREGPFRVTFLRKQLENREFLHS